MVREINEEQDDVEEEEDEEEEEKDPERDPFEGSFSEAMDRFVLHIAEDPHAKESVIAAFGDNKTFLKPADVSVREHQERIAVLCHYVNQLPGTRGKLTPAERRNIFFNTFPKTWRDAFRKTAHDVTTCSVQTIKEWMTIKKDDMDREYNKKKKEKESKKNEKKPMKKGKQNSSDICKIHGGHKWKYCKLNPRSPNFDQQAYDRHQANKQGGRGFGRGFGRGGGRGGRGFHGGRGFGRGPPREQYYQQEYPDQSYSNGPPSTIHTDQQSYATHSYNPPPSRGNWYGNYY